MSLTKSRPSSLSQSLAIAREVRGFEQAAAELQEWMQEKATQTVRDICDHSPSSVQTLQQQHRGLEVRAPRFPCGSGDPPHTQRGEGKAFLAREFLPGVHVEHSGAGLGNPGKEDPPPTPRREAGVLPE